MTSGYEELRWEHKRHIEPIQIRVTAIDLKSRENCKHNLSHFQQADILASTGILSHVKLAKETVHFTSLLVRVSSIFAPAFWTMCVDVASKDIRPAVNHPRVDTTHSPFRNLLRR